MLGYLTLRVDPAQLKGEAAVVAGYGWPSRHRARSCSWRWMATEDDRDPADRDEPVATAVGPVWTF